MNGPDNQEQTAKPEAESAAPQNETPEVIAGHARPADPRDADDVLTHKMPAALEDNESRQAADDESRQAADAAVLAASGRRTRRTFLIGGAAASAAAGFYHWLRTGSQNEMLPTLLHRVYSANADVSRTVLGDHALAPTYPVSRAVSLRVNGVFGLKQALEMDSYRLQVVGVANADQHPRYTEDVTAWEYRYVGRTLGDQGHDTKVDPRMESSPKMAPMPMLHQAKSDEEHTGRRPRGLEEAGESYSTLRPGTPGLLLQLEDFLSSLPRHQLVTQFKCIEGWSEIVHWGGVRLADFIQMYPPALVDGKEPRYVYMETPDGDYYVGYDLEICRHPQSLLVTEMSGAPLEQFHGAPLRVHMPTRYGYKQIKRVGLIAYTNEKPADYWTKLGYDWYGGL